MPEDNHGVVGCRHGFILQSCDDLGCMAIDKLAKVDTFFKEVGHGHEWDEAHERYQRLWREVNDFIEDHCLFGDQA